VVGIQGIEAVSLRQDKADAKAEEAGKKLGGHESCGWFQYVSIWTCCGWVPN